MTVEEYREINKQQENSKYRAQKHTVNTDTFTTAKKKLTDVMFCT